MKESGPNHEILQRISNLSVRTERVLALKEQSYRENVEKMEEIHREAAQMQEDEMNMTQLQSDPLRSAELASLNMRLRGARIALTQYTNHVNLILADINRLTDYINQINTVSQHLDHTKLTLEQEQLIERCSRYLDMLERG